MLRHTAKLFASLGHTVSIYYLYGQANLQGVQGHKGISVTKVPTRYGTWARRSKRLRGLAYAPSCYYLQKEIDRLNADAVIGFKPIGSAIVSRLSKFSGRKIASLHGSYLSDLPACRYVDKSKLDLVTVLSKETQEHYKALFNEVRVVPNPFQLPEVDPSIETKKQIINVTRLDGDKRTDLFIKAAALAKAQLPDYRFLIAGDGKKREELEALNASLGKPVTFLGKIPHHDLPALYQASEAMVLASEAEGQPMVLVEAAHFGTPRITTRFKGGGLEYLVKDQINGLVAELTPESLAGAIVTMSRSPEARDRFREAGFELAKQLQKSAIDEWSKIANEG